MMETKKSSSGTKLLDQGLKLLFIMHTRRSFSGTEIYLCANSCFWEEIYQ